MRRNKRSVALQYSSSLPAPFVVARGSGLLAERLVRMAQEHQIAVVEAGELAESLYQVEVGTYIPEPFYDVVAEILAFIWRQNSIEGGKGVSG